MNVIQWFFGCMFNWLNSMVEFLQSRKKPEYGVIKGAEPETGRKYKKELVICHGKASGGEKGEDRLGSGAGQPGCRSG